MTHEHKYFAFQIKADFIPLNTEGVILYKRVEYMFSSCGCGLSKKTEVNEIESAAPKEEK